MKIKPAKKYTNLFIFAAFIILNACKPQGEKLYIQAYEEIEKGHFRIALDLLEKSAALERNNQIKYRYFFESARIARFEIQDYERAIRTYRNIILNSEDETMRMSSQEAIAEIYFENLQNYKLALKELLLIEGRVKEKEKKEKITFRIAQAQYFIGNNQLALEEIDTALGFVTVEKFNFIKLKAQILVAQKKYHEAIENYESIRIQSPKFFEEENLFMATSIAYEENEEYAEALKYLKKYEKQINDKSYLELRYRRLEERLVNKPLFKGKRK